MAPSGAGYAFCVSHSTNGGSTWTRLLLSGAARGFCYSLAIAPSQPGIVYAGGWADDLGKVYRSEDAGRSWAATGSAPADTVMCLAVHPDDPAVAYAATRSGVYRTTDGGSAWVNTGGGSGLCAVAVFPQGPDTVFAAGDSGVIVSTDGGGSWVDFSAGLGVPGVNCLGTGTHEGVRVYAGTRGGAAYVHEFTTGIGASPGRGNPGPSLVVRPSVVRTGGGPVVSVWCPPTGGVSAELKLVDAAGSVVRELVTGPGGPGELLLDTGDLNPGVYFVRLGGRSGGAGQKLVVTR